MGSEPRTPGWLRALLGSDCDPLHLEATFEVQAGDRDLQGIDAYPEIMRIWLSGTQVTDAGMAHLARQSQLRLLSLEDTRITDAGLEQLTGLANLEWLILRGTRTTDAGQRKLQSALPNCKIVCRDKWPGVPRYPRTYQNMPNPMPHFQPHNDDE